MATEGNVLELPKESSWYSPSKLKHYIGVAIKDYPVLWLTILFAVLIFPAITAPWTAPHDPLKQELSKRLTAPVWSTGTEDKPPILVQCFGDRQAGT